MASDRETFRTWIYTELSNGVSADVMLKTAREQNVLSEERAQNFWREVANWQQRKLHSLTALAQLSRMHLGRVEEIDVLTNASAETFYNGYLDKSQPAILKDFATDWPCYHKWTLDHLQQTIGDTEVAVNTERSTERTHDREYHQKVISMSMQDYIHRIKTESPTNDFYLVAHANAWKADAFAQLHSDVPLDPAFFDPQIKKRDGISFWLGPAGTWTPLHCDPVNNLVTIIKGKKRFRLIDPYQTELMNTAEGFYNRLRATDLKAHPNPNFRKIPVFEVEVEAPDALFIPAGWWHEVESLDITLHLSMTGTYGASQYKTYKP